MDNATLLIIAGIAIIVLIARKWDSFKWIFALALVALGLWTAYQMGLFDAILPAGTPKVTW